MEKNYVPTNLLEFQNVSKFYTDAKTDALNKVSFTLKKGTFCFITGHSGAGKTTLLKLISGLVKPTYGLILFEKKNLASISAVGLQLMRQKMGIVFQEPNLVDTLNVFDNVAIPLLTSVNNKKDIKYKVRNALQMVQLDSREKAMPTTLSGGEQQRISIARAIVNMPKLLIADEPTGNLDLELSKQMIELFQKINKNNCTVLIATHEQSLMSWYSGRHIALEKGKIVHDGHTSDVA